MLRYPLSGREASGRRCRSPTRSTHPLLREAAAFLSFLATSSLWRIELPSENASKTASIASSSISDLWMNLFNFFLSLSLPTSPPAASREPSRTPESSPSGSRGHLKERFGRRAPKSFRVRTSLRLRLPLPGPLKRCSQLAVLKRGCKTPLSGLDFEIKFPPPPPLSTRATPFWVFISTHMPTLYGSGHGMSAKSSPPLPKENSCSLSRP
mmetsp:Transcript_37206/g.73205  ORF Transcript_37206/g.73205 Transcript_37206/m.73205 type:complete len:210 (+) Transcript_37206:292-921(+)